MIKGLKKTFKKTFGKKEKSKLKQKVTWTKSNVSIPIHYTPMARSIQPVNSACATTLYTPHMTVGTFIHTSYDGYPQKTPDIQIHGDMVTFYFDKGYYSMPLKQVKEYGYRVSIITAYIKAEKSGWFNYGALASTLSISPTNIIYTSTPSLNTTIGTMSWVDTTTTGNAMYIGYTI